MTFQSVMTAEQAADAKKRDEDKPAASPASAIGGMLGRFGRKKPAEETKDKEPAQASTAPAAGEGRSTIMTSTNDLLAVASSVNAADLQVPAGFRQK
jgi:hypothetical protein